MEKVTRDQELLQSTQDALEAETQEMFQVSNRLNDNYVKALKMMWGHLLIIWLVVIVLFVISFFVIRSFYTSPQVSEERLQASPPPELAGDASGTAFSGQAVAAQPQPQISPSSPSEGEKVKDVLRQVREAQLKKDINLLAAAYSPTFPGLADKKERILKTWSRYNYLDLDFKLANITQKTANTMMADVVWNLICEDLRSKEKTTLVKKFTVHFTKVSGQWLIQNLAEE
jgi:hypothetical protein